MANLDIVYFDKNANLTIYFICKLTKQPNEKKSNHIQNKNK